MTARRIHEISADDPRGEIKSKGNAIGVKRSNRCVYQPLFENRYRFGIRRARWPPQTIDYAVGATYAIKSADSVVNLSRRELCSYGMPVHFP